MRTLMTLMTAIALMLSVGTAMAGTDEHQNKSNGFYALSAVTGGENEPMNALTDVELSTIEGGLIGPDGDLNDFPRWLWPVIRTASFSFGGSEVMFNPQPEPPKGLGGMMNMMKYQYR